MKVRQHKSAEQIQKRNKSNIEIKLLFEVLLLNISIYKNRNAFISDLLCHLLTKQAHVPQ